VALARGDLSSEPPEPRSIAGRDAAQLHSALAALRQSLRERLQASAQAQATLESEVAARTAELRQRTAELEAALAALADTQAELLRAEQLASIGRLIAGIAHEINNPVNAVVNTAAPLAELLGEIEAALRRTTPAAPSVDELRPLLAEMAEMLGVLERGARRTHEIVRALRDYSQGGSETPEPLVPVALHPLIDEAWALVQDPIKPRVQLDRAYGELPLVPGLGGKLQQVFTNLLSNALYALRQRAAMSQQGFVPRLRILTRAAGEQVFIEVTDNGVGMPQEVRMRAFDPFFTTKDINDGSGLGLSIVHGIVRRHGGDVGVRSQPGEGTTFTISLPLAARDPSP
jgi:two-component system NtrC family sensor kinase